MQRSMIYHYPLPLKEEVSGSQVHVGQMLKAFRELGYDVALVAGFASERKEAVARLKHEAATGRSFDFLYAWSPTVPTLLVKRNLLHPWLDRAFFRWCRARAVPIGLFYGDVHWRFAHYRSSAPWWRRALAIPLYRYDWASYVEAVDHLFLPSLSMADSLPTAWPRARMTALYPGCNIAPAARQQPPAAAECLELFYVGGVKPPLYDLKPMLDGVRGLDGVRLTLCCRPYDWAEVKAYYEPLDPASMRIVHAHGEQLEAYYAAASLFGLFWRPYAYLDFAMPVKVFESMGHGVPIVTMAGTEVARFVAREDIGWVVASVDEFRALLAHLKANPQEMAAKRRQVEEVRLRHTWRVRAQMIADTLTAGRSDLCGA